MAATSARKDAVNGDAAGPAAPSAPAAAASEAQQWEKLKSRRWARGTELTADVQDLALRAGKRARVATSGGSYKKFLCSSTSPCTWVIHAVCSRPRRARRGDAATGTAEEPATRFWHVTSGSLTHAENCDSVARPTARQLRASSLLRSAVEADMRVSSAELMAQLESCGTLRCSKSMVYKAKSELLDALEAAQRSSEPSAAACESMQHLPGYLSQLQALNAHVAVAIDTEPASSPPEPNDVVKATSDGGDAVEKGEASGKGGDVRFVRALLALDPTGVWSQQSVLGLDSAQMTHNSYDGTLLALIGRDGDLQPVLHAVALVPEASDTHCDWFLTKLEAHGFPLRRFPIVAGGSGSLSAACGRLKLPHVMQCTRQVLRDLREAQGGSLSSEEEALVWRAQCAEAESEHLAAVAQLARQNADMARRLRLLEPARWALYPYVAMRKMYGWQTSLLEELKLGQSLGLAPPTSQLPYECLKALSLVAMQAAFQRHERATQWERERRVVTPAAERLMQEQLARVPLYSVCMSSANLAFVWNAHKSQIRQRRVDLQHRTCTCTRRLQWGIPCRHLLAALQKLGALAQAPDFFDECYLVRNYVSSFKGRSLELPVEETVMRDTTILPPRLLHKHRSIPKGGAADGQNSKKKRKRRVRTRPVHERKRGMYKCRRCHRAEGHNKGTCPYPPA